MLAPILVHSALVMASATWYGSGSLCANGKSPAENRARYGLCAACNRERLGDRVLASLPSRHGVRGGRVLVTITDRIGAGSDLDLRPEAAKVLLGPRYRIVGRVSGVRLRVIRHK